jgi:hypothetical protein
MKSAVIHHPDPALSRAVIIGVPECAHSDRWPPIPAVRANVSDLQRSLADPATWGLPSSHCAVFINPKDPGAVLEAVSDAARLASDTVLVYYAGHGAPTHSDLLLTLSVTTGDNLLYRSLRFAMIREIIQTRRARHAVIILDCCFSGRAHAMADATAFLDSQISESSAYVLTSSARDSVSLSPPGEKYTAFTGELPRVFANGLAESDDYLTLAEIAHATISGLARRSLPIPRHSQSGAGDRIGLIANRRAWSDLGDGQPYQFRQIDLVLCIDVSVIAAVRDDLADIHQDLASKSRMLERPLDPLRVRVMSFGRDEAETRSSPFFVLPGDTAEYINSLARISPGEGGGIAQGTETLTLAIRSAWAPARQLRQRRQVIAVLTDRAGTSTEPDTLYDDWRNSMDHQAKTLIVLAPDVEPWNRIAADFENTIHIPTELNQRFQDITPDWVDHVVYEI